MTKTTTCKYCRSNDVREDLVCIRMCELCCKQSVDILFDGVGPVMRSLLRRHMRKWRRMSD